MHLSVVVPCFNEEGNIAGVIESAAEIGRSVASQLEIVVVDDGSTDGTPGVLHDLRRAVPELTVLRHPVNRGYGAALRTGFEGVSHDTVFLTDGDGQFDLRELPDAAAMLQTCDVVAGYRRRRSDGQWRGLFGRAWTGLVNLALGIEVRDVNCAFKLLPRALVQSTRLTSDGALISAEVLFEARRRGLRIREFPVSHRPRTSGAQSGASVPVVARAFTELATYVVRDTLASRPGIRNDPAE
ncbi:MAG: glycosyltransferase family 2 protein [Myxococcota bacterium]